VINWSKNDWGRPYHIGYYAAKMILQRIYKKNDKHTDRFVPVKLVVRSSVSVILKRG